MIIYTDINNIPVIILTIDYEKAFDSHISQVTAICQMFIDKTFELESNNYHVLQ